MKASQWIGEDRSFYHLTPSSNISSILVEGLQNRNGRGICVIRSIDENVIEYLCQAMLYVGEPDFAIIEIKPSKHKLRAEEIGWDTTTEVTTPLHNYILRNKLPIEQGDIIGSHSIVPNGILDYKEYEATLISQGKIEELERG
jgi:hypothetical protein